LNRIAALRIPLTLIYVLGILAILLKGVRSSEVLGCSFVFRRLRLCARMVAYLKPSNDGNWQPDSARTARTEIDADHNSQFTQLRSLVERDGALNAALCSVGVFSQTPKRGSARHGRKQRMTASELVENACVPDRFQQVLHLSASGQNSRATVKGHERRPEEGGAGRSFWGWRRRRKMHGELGFD
jgi:hypothetical protein